MDPQGQGPMLNKLVDKPLVQYLALSNGIEDAILGIFSLIDQSPHQCGLIEPFL